MPPFSIFSQAVRRLNAPILAPILESRTLGWAIIGAVTLHFGLVLGGLPGLPCPIRETLGIPCPGCGLSRGIAALLYGDWQTSLYYHIFAPIFLAAFGVVVITSLLPAYSRQKMIGWVGKIEGKLGLSGFLPISLVVYWLIRLLFFREAFVRLIIEQKF